MFDPHISPILLLAKQLRKLALPSVIVLAQMAPPTFTVEINPTRFEGGQRADRSAPKS
ncbi:hypothetical protein [Mesorhizobium sp.]|uniref:hypothetical protein n=1 Tax=Mesorhizobium sp. TaxID=1871066 RepID=UPI0025F58895|nr:hypothetical protein [Mesorhizobium sp.]